MIEISLDGETWQPLNECKNDEYEVAATTVWVRKTAAAEGYPVGVVTDHGLAPLVEKFFKGSISPDDYTILIEGEGRVYVVVNHFTYAIIVLVPPTPTT